MKLSIRQLRHIIREAMDSPLKAEKYAFNKMLTRVLQDINEESIPFGNDKEVVAAIDAVEAAMLNLQHVIFNSQAGQQLREHVGDEHHEHPHEHSKIAVPRVNNKDEAEDLLHDTFLAVEEHLSLEEIEAIIAMLY